MKYYQSKTECYTRYITETRYNKLSQNVQQWYEPMQDTQPLNEETLLNLLKTIDPNTKRLPPGFLQFARLIEQQHGIV